jgi:DNA-binding transcriptional LysR family regulator
MAHLHPLLQIHTCYSDRFVDLIAEGFDCAVRIGFLRDSNLIGRHVGPINGRLVASPEYVKTHGSPKTPDELLDHQALMQGTETWQFMDGEETVTIHPKGQFKADNGTALLAAALAGIGIVCLPDGITEKYLASGSLVPVMTSHPMPTAGIYVVRPPSQHPVRKVRILAEMLTEGFVQQPPR